MIPQYLMFGFSTGLGLFAAAEAPAPEINDCRQDRRNFYYFAMTGELPEGFKKAAKRLKIDLHSKPKDDHETP